MQVQLTSSLYGGAARNTDWTSMAECGILIVFGTSVIIGFNKLQTKFSIKSIRKYINFDYFNKKYFNAQEAFFLLVVACHMASYFLSSYGKIYGLIGPNYSWLTETLCIFMYHYGDFSSLVFRSSRYFLENYMRLLENTHSFLCFL